MANKGEYGRGSIRQKGNRWQIRYYVDDGVDENGQRERKRVTESFKTKAEARKRLNTVVAAALVSACTPNPPPPRTTRLERGLDDYNMKMASTP